MPVRAGVSYKGEVFSRGTVMTSCTIGVLLMRRNNIMLGQKKQSIYMVIKKETNLLVTLSIIYPQFIYWFDICSTGSKMSVCKHNFNTLGFFFFFKGLSN